MAMTGDKLPMRAWAVLADGGQLLLTDGRCPLFWRRGPAKAYGDLHFGPKQYAVIRVVVTRCVQ